MEGQSVALARRRSLGLNSHLKMFRCLCVHAYLECISAGHWPAPFMITLSKTERDLLARMLHALPKRQSDGMVCFQMTEVDWIRLQRLGRACENGTGKITPRRS